MNQQDKSFLITFTTVLSVLVIITVAIFLAARMVSLVSVAPDDGVRKQATAEERIKPVAKVAVAGASAPQATKAAATPAPVATQVASAKQPGEDTFNAACTACHTAGVLGAPKLGSKQDWEPRFAQGLDTLVNHAVNGIRSMPAKGGNPALTEQDIKNTVTYMLQKSSIKVETTGTAVAAAQPAAPVPAAAAPSVPAPAAAAPAAVAAAPAPVKPESTPAAQEPLQRDALLAVQQAAKAAQEAAAAAREAMAAAREALAAAKEATAAAKAAATQPIPVPAPAKEIKPALTPEHAAPPAKETPAPAPAVPEHAAPPAKETPAPAPAVPEHAAPPAKETPAPATPGHAAPTTQETAPAPNQQQAAAALTLPVGIDLARGRQLYNTACIICHRTGVSGAPKLDDKVAWAPRLAQGFNSLATYALHRYKGMLTMDVADKDIVSAVGYMVSVVQ